MGSKLLPGQNKEIVEGPQINQKDLVGLLSGDQPSKQALVSDYKLTEEC